MQFGMWRLASFIAAAVLLSACADSETVSSSDPLLSGSATGTVSEDDSGSESAPLSNIVDTAVNASSFTTLVAALQATSLDAVLADESKTFTVFAPNDDAFAKLGEETINALLADTDTLSNILLYHVVSDAAVDAATAVSLAGSTVAMTNGDETALSLDGSRLFVNMSGVVATDIKASNGIIHVIDTVLLPPEQAPEVQPGNIIDVASAAGTFNTLTAALQATGLDQVLIDNDNEFTVFAPTDEAFAKLPEGTVEALLADPDTLSDILLYHVLSGSRVDSVTAISLAGNSTATANGDDIALSVDDGSLFINQSRVIAADIQASNGIIHVIDTVLLPPADVPITETPGEVPTTSTPGDSAPELNDSTPPTGTIFEVATAAGNFTTLVAAVELTGLDSALDHPDDIYTVFAPTDAAFAALGQDTINALLADPDTLRDILRFHVVAGTVVDAATALSLVGFDIQAANGGSLLLSQSGDDLLINGVRIVATDIQAVNGVIHVIDAVLIP